MTQYPNQPWPAGPPQQPYYPPQAPPQQPYYPPQGPPQQPYYPPPAPQQQPYYPAQAPPQQYGPPQQAPPQYGVPAAPGGADQPGPGQPYVIPIASGSISARLGASMGGLRTIIVAPDYIAMQAKKTPFQVGWNELRRVVVTKAYHQSDQVFSRKTWRIRLVLDAADPSFFQRHPEMIGLQGKWGGTGEGSMGIPLGPAENCVDPLVRGLSSYGRSVFGGVIDEGQVMGFGYL